MADSTRIHNIEINWTYPCKLENIETKWECNTNGLYYISRKFNKKESPIYIGETKRDFITRINEHYHDVSEFFNKRGIKYIRLGRIVKPQSLKSYNDVEVKHLLQVIESRLIEDLYENGVADALCNTRQVNSYSNWYKLNITNSGKRGALSKELPYKE